MKYYYKDNALEKGILCFFSDINEYSDNYCKICNNKMLYYKTNGPTSYLEAISKSQPEKPHIFYYCKYYNNFWHEKCHKIYNYIKNCPIEKIHEMGKDQIYDTQRRVKNILGFQKEYRFLSNFWPCQITYEGVEYPSVENAYQAAKTLDLKKREDIAKFTASESKKAGRKLEIRTDWEHVKFDIMRELIYLKFSSDKELRQKLTSLIHFDYYLEETNNWKDTYWGVCNGEGQNKLGYILMSVGLRLIEENRKLYTQ